MEKSILKIIKRSRSSNQRLILVILGNVGLKKLPDLYKLVSREKSINVNWFSRDNSDIRKVGWMYKTNENNDKQDDNDEPKVTHVSFSDIQNTSLQSSYFTIVQDLKNIKPSEIAKVIESVTGKGVLVFIFSNVTELSKCISPTDCDFLKSNFMKRLFASFTKCYNSAILNDKLNILLIPKNEYMMEVDDVHESSGILQNENEHSEFFDKLIKLCCTKDQSQFLNESLETLRRRSIHCTISASSPKGRGKSVVLGLAIAGAIALKYSNIFISSLDYNNVKVIFKYLLMGLDAIDFKEDEDYDLIQSVNPKFSHALLGLNIFRDHPQAVRFIYPGDVENKLEQAELVVIDEAAAMPLPLLKKLLGPYIVLMTSTTESCEGSGKYLYDNMVSEIQRSTSLKNNNKTVSLVSLFPTSETISWKKILLTEPVNYAKGDEVEKWMNHLLCLNCCMPTASICPDPKSCNLFYVCRETLFSCEEDAEDFLQQLMSLFFCTKRNISPDILLKIADDDNYHIFCLMPPYDSPKKKSILCAILVHTEKRVPCNVIYSGINQPEDLNMCFNEWVSVKENAEDFLPMQGIHIIDIATFPNYRKMGYGSQALRLMQDFYEGKCISLDDKPYIYSSRTKKFAPLNDDSQSSPRLLLQLSGVEPEKVDYILVSYFLTPDLLRFWKRVEFVPVYISGEKDVTQEHLCFMMKGISNDVITHIKELWQSFRANYFMYLSSYLKHFPAELALNLLNCKFGRQLPKKELNKEHIDVYLKPQRMKSLEKYCQNLGDLHCVMPCIPILAKLFFSHRFVGVEMPVAQQVILLAFGLQHKTIEDISSDLSLHTTQIHGLLNRTIRKLTTHLTSIIEKTVEKTMAVRDINMEPVSQSLDDELEEAAQKIKEKQKEDLKKLKEMDFSEFAIKGSEDDWEKALHCGRKTLVSIKSLKEAPEDVEKSNQEKNKSFKHKKKENKRKR